MSLRIIYGRAGAGKSRFCLQDIKEKLKSGDDQPLILIVPEQFSLQAEKNLLRTVGPEGILKAEVLSFRRMAYRVFNDVGGITRNRINSAGKCMLIYRILEGMKNDFKIFSKAVRQKGFINTLSQTISELKRYNVSPQALETAGNALRDNILLRDKLSELARIFLHFETALHEKYMDADDDLTELFSRLDKCNSFNGAEIWVDEFSGFTPQEYAVLEKLLGKAKRLNICLCTDCLDYSSVNDNTEVFSPAKRTAAKLAKLADVAGVGIEECISLDGKERGRFSHCDELRHLEGYLFSYPYKVYPNRTENISVLSAANIYSEVENIARGIITLCREKEIRYRDIAVVARNLERYEKLVGAVFAEYGIPCFVDRKKDITSHPLVLLILSAMEIFTSNWSYESVFKYLKTGLLGITREDIDILENYVLACGIRGSRWTQQEKWNYRLMPDYDNAEVPEYEQKIIDKVNLLRGAVTAPLLEFRSKTRGKTKARDICAALFEYLCNAGIHKMIDRRVEEFKKAGELNLANEYSQVWNIVMELLDQLVDTIGNEHMGIERFTNILGIGLAEYKLGLIPPALDQVLVGSVERSKSHEIKALYVLGVNDGVFPAASAEEGILSDDDRECLRSIGIELAQDTRTKAFEEQYLIYTALTTPEQYLHLSFPAADHEGRTMRPSIIISRIRKLFPKVTEQGSITGVNNNDNPVELLAAPVPVFNELTASLRKYVEGMDVNPLWAEVYRWYVKNDQWKQRCCNALEGLNYSSQVGSVAPEKVRQLYGSPMHSSVSRLESYASCPFSYYIQYGLKARERRIFKLSPPDIGTFMHSAIDRFSKKLVDEQISWRHLEREWCADAVAGIVDDMLSSMKGSILNSSERYKFLSGRLKRVLTRAVWLIAEHIKRSGFEPVGYEVFFGEGGQYPPITVSLPSGENIHLTGRIDRIDKLTTEKGTYLRIIDYKSGNKAFKLDDVYYGLQIQLITYMDAVLHSGDVTGDGSLSRSREGDKEPSSSALPGGILYFRIDDPIIKGSRGLTEEEIERAIMKQLKMKGLLLADVKLIREMDREIDGDSIIVPARINKGDVLGRSSAATLEQFELVRGHIKRLLSQIGGEMLNGNISIRPYKKKRFTPCIYCNYSAICQFDPSLKDNTYKMLNDMKDEEVWKRIRVDEEQ